MCPEKVALKTRGLRIKVFNQCRVAARDLQEIFALTQLRLFNRGGDVKHVVAFRHNQSLEINIATRDSVIDFARGGAMVKSVLAGFKRFASVQIVPRQECVLAADDSGIRQVGCDVARRRTRLKLHQLLLRRPAGRSSP